VLHRCAGDDADLGDGRGQILEPFAPYIRQAFADQHEEVKARIPLRGDRGQGESFEMPEPERHAVRVIKIGLAFGDGVMHPLEAALGGIGEATDTNDTHETDLA